MIYIGLDDTDTLDSPGTNQLARHLVTQLACDFEGQLIVRHQLLEHPEVPCTRKNGCASILLKPRGSMRCTQLIAKARQIVATWCPTGSDPGLCVAETVPQEIVDWGERCKRKLVTRNQAYKLAAQHGIHLEGLGGTHDGVIGALAAIGLLATGNDGRVVYLGASSRDLFEIGGCLSTETVFACGIAAIQDFDSGRLVSMGTVDVGKRLRPNYRDSRAVLFVRRKGEALWEAVRTV